MTTKRPNTTPPEPAGWDPFWHGYFQKSEVRSAAKRMKDKKTHHPAGISERIMREGELEKQVLLNVLSDIKKSHINMFELGAGRGDLCLSMAGVVDFHLIPTQIETYKCLAVEAEPIHYRWTKEHFEQQGINGIAVHGAVHHYDGVCRFQADTDPASHYGQSICSDGNIEVPCCTIDSLMERYSFDHVDLIHMDVQGAEYDALRGAQKALNEGKIDYLMIGVHTVNKKKRNWMNTRIKKRLRDQFEILLDIPPNTDSVYTPLGAATLPVDGMMLCKRKQVNGNVSLQRWKDFFKKSRFGSFFRGRNSQGNQVC